MKKYFVVFLIISLILGVVTFLSLNNIFIGVAVILISIACSVLLFIPKLKKFYEATDRYLDTYHFINNFIITLSIKNSISGALENTTLSMGESFLTFYSKLEDLTEDEKINYLESYFPFYSYKLFLQIIHLWENEGGDVLAMSNYLLSEIRYEQEYVSSIKILAKRKYVESFSLWLICISLVVLLRFTLNDFYQRIINQPVFIISIVCIMLFVLFSIFLLIEKATKINLKGYNPNEKII